MDTFEKWLVIGASGLLGYRLCEYLLADGKEVFGTVHEHPIGLDGVSELKVNLLDLDTTLRDTIKRLDIDVIVYAAGLTNVDACEENENLAYEIHVSVPEELAKWSLDCNIRFVNISTDHLWDGSVPMVTENIIPQPMNAYARTKADGEAAVMEAFPDSLTVRTNFYGAGRPWRTSLSDWILSSLRSGREVKAFINSYFTPICLAHLCPTLVGIVECNAKGIYNLVGSERVSKYEFASELAHAFSLPNELIVPGKLENAGLVAPRPEDMSLSSDKIANFIGHSMPNLKEGLKALKNEKKC